MVQTVRSFMSSPENKVVRKAEAGSPIRGLRSVKMPARFQMLAGRRATPPNWSAASSPFEVDDAASLRDCPLSRYVPSLIVHAEHEDIPVINALRPFWPVA